MLRVLLTIVQVFSSLAIIALVLIQRGKGAEAGAGFGAGASGTVFGARGATTALSRATAIFAAVFMINSLLLTYMGTHAAPAQQKSILDTVVDKTTTTNGTKLSVTPTTAPPPAATGSSAPAAPAATPAPAPAAPAPAAPTSSAPAQPAPETAPK
jgi:preprotein translocase subunit SecG